MRGIQTLHVDLETTGLDPTDPSQHIVGLGVAGEGCAYYLDVRGWAEGGPEWAAVRDWFTVQPIVCFNATFDCAWLWRYFGGVHPKLAGCSYVLFRLLANEDYPGQRWNLQALQELIGWAGSNKDVLCDLLRRHGIVNQAGNPDRGRMAELAVLEPDEFGRYCALDAEASRQGWDYLVAEATRLGLHEAVLSFMRDEWVTSIQCIVEQQHNGCTMPMEGVDEYHRSLLLDIQKAEGCLREQVDLAPHITEWESGAATDYYQVRVRRKRVRLRANELADLATRPWEWRFQPSVAKNLKRFEAEAGGYFFKESAELSVTNADKPPPRFNWESDQQLRWLLWERVFRDRIAMVATEDGSSLRFTPADGDPVDLELTGAGQYPVGRTVMPSLGAVGRAINDFNKLTKLRGYVQAYRDAAERDGKIHLSFRAHGTSTGRLSGGSG